MRHIVIASAALMAMIMMGAACSMPATTRTALVKDVQIADDLKPDSVLVHPGDEIRWVNTRKDSVQLDIPNLANRSLSCARGFTNWLGRTSESVHLKPNQTASLCFSQPTVVHYVVRAESPTSAGRDLMSGSIQVSGG
jgi:plastocyanin